MVASNVRIEPFKFYLPKVSLVFLIWIFITLNAICVKFEEIDNSETWLSKNKTILKNGLGILMIFYSLYLTVIIQKAFQNLMYMKPNFKLVFNFTIGVIMILVFCLLGSGVKVYLSEVVSLYVFNSIFCLINLYVIAISYIYCPSNTRLFPLKMSEHEMQ